MAQSWAVVTNISDVKLTRMYLPGGVVYDFWYDAAQKATTKAIAFAPVGEMWHGHTNPVPGWGAPYAPGNLKAHIRMRGEKRVRRNQLVFFVVAATPYASYVHEGTGRIIAHSEKGMAVPLPPKRLRTLGKTDAQLAKRGARFGDKIPRSTKAGFRVYMREVNGQEANPFLTEAIGSFTRNELPILKRRYSEAKNLARRRRPIPGLY